MDSLNMTGLVQNKLEEFTDGLNLLQKQNNEALDGANLVQACLPYISIKAAGVNYRRYLPQKIKLKVEALLTKIFE
jgi:hypothetical protein